MDTTEHTTPAQTGDSLILQHVPAFAAFVRDHHLDDFTRHQITLSRAIDVPLLKFFAGMSEEQLFEFSRTGAREFLTYLAENRADEQIEIGRKNWLSNQLPLIDRYSVVAEDLTYVTHVRRRGLTEFMARYTTDFALALCILAELDAYFLKMETVNMNTYIDLLKDKIDQTSRELEKKQDQLLEAQDIAGLGSFVWNLDTRESEVTPQVMKILDLERTGDMAVFINKVHPHDRERVQRAIDDAVKNNALYECEYRLQTSEGEKTIWSRGTLTSIDGQTVMTGTLMDVTERSRLLRQLQRSDELFRQAQALAHIGSWTANRATQRMTWTEEMYRIFGLEPQTGEIPFATWQELPIHLEDHGKINAAIQHTLATGEPFELHYRIVLGSDVRVVHCRGELQREEEGAPRQLYGTVQDVTAAKRAELEIIAKSKELESINFELQKFASVASHDLREPLRKVELFGSLLEKDFRGQLGEKGGMYIDKITAATARMQDLISDILDFSRLRAGEVAFKRIDLNAVVEQVQSDMEVVIDHTDATVNVGQLPTIEANPAQLGQLFQNLLSNAIKFRRPDKAPVIDIYAEIIEGALTPEDFSRRVAYDFLELARNSMPGPSQFCRIYVRDNGIGFDESYLEKIFQLFQRLHNKNEYDGTGIGLAICQRVVENHHGAITARSKPGEGATFVITLPLVQPR